MHASEDVFIEPLLILAAKEQLDLISSAQKEIQILKHKFQPVLDVINKHLETLLQDRDLIANILIGLKRKGL